MIWIMIQMKNQWLHSDTNLRVPQTQKDEGILEMKAMSGLAKEDGRESRSKAPREEMWKFGSSREMIANKYATTAEQQVRQSSVTLESREKGISPVSVSLLHAGNSQKQSTDILFGSSGIASTWASIKTGYYSFKANNIGAEKFIPLHQAQETSLHAWVLSSVDEVFQRLKVCPSRDRRDFVDDDGNGDNADMITGPTR